MVVDIRNFQIARFIGAGTWNETNHKNIFHMRTFWDWTKDPSPIHAMWRRKREVYNTKYSQAVTHPSTNFARPGLTSVIRREPVLSWWYGRRHQKLPNCAFYRRRYVKWDKSQKHFPYAYILRLNERPEPNPRDVAAQKGSLQHEVFPGGHPSKY